MGASANQVPDSTYMACLLATTAAAVFILSPQQAHSTVQQQHEWPTSCSTVQPAGGPCRCRC
jgi:hypothetical protein